MPATASPSFASRTRPMKLAMAPIAGSARRKAAISAPISKSSRCTRTAISAPGHRREERDLIARRNWRILAREILVDRNAHRLALAEGGSWGPATRDQLRAEAFHVAGPGRQVEQLLGYAHVFAQPRKVENSDAHWNNSEKGRNFTASPRRIACLAGLSMKPSPHTTEVRTAELWFGNRSSPPAGFNLARRNSRRASGFAQSKSTRSG